jgi:hypothetical protein
MKKKKEKKNIVKKEVKENKQDFAKQNPAPLKRKNRFHSFKTNLKVAFFLA